MLQINQKLKNLFQGILKDFVKKEDLKIIYKQIGYANNSVQTIDLDQKITYYDFLVIESGWGYYKSTAVIPTFIFVQRNESFSQCYFQVKTYGGNSFISLNYINSTTFRINGEVGQDTQTSVYGVKIQK